MKTVITHNGIFHADEVIAIALLRIAGFSRLNIVRTSDKAEIEMGIKNPTTFVIDVGGIHDPSKRNFDHHQDKGLPSAAGLVYEYFKDQICDKDSQPFFSKFIASIDAIDTNRDNIYKTWNTLPDGFRNTSNIISGFNRNPDDHDEQQRQFEAALTFAYLILVNEIHFCQIMLLCSMSSAQFGKKKLITYLRFFRICLAGKSYQETQAWRLYHNEFRLAAGLYSVIRLDLWQLLKRNPPPLNLPKHYDPHPKI